VKPVIRSRYINIIIAGAVVLALIAGLLTVHYAKQETEDSGVTQEYASKLFGGDIISIEITADQSEWEAMLENAMAEEYIMADVVINGTRFQSVGIRPKGNSSLSQVASSSSTDRYSFRIKFDKYIDGQTCFGLDTFVLNNMLGDNSYMKEYISYDIMNYIGVNTPLYDFADITVNGEKWGFYLAVEAYDDSYMSRVYGDSSGSLYNVKTMDKGDNDDNQTAADQTEMTEGQMPQRPEGGAGPGMPPGGERPEKPEGQMPDMTEGQMPDMPGARMTENDAAEGADLSAQPGADTADGPVETGQIAQNTLNAEDQTKSSRRNNMGGGRTSGGDLKYTDDDPDSYSAVFANAVGDTTEAEQQRVITALKNLSTGNELEKYFDTDQILRYMAAHTVVVNLDSYSSSMAQNYYIYENNGQVSILPWDYNFSFGGFQSGSASAVVNYPIDTPVSGVTLEDRPLFAQLLADEEYKAKYHQYLEEIVAGYFADGKWEAKVNQLDSLIAEYVESDPGAFCTFAQYKKALPALIKLGELRAESIAGQLDGTVPSTTEEQNNNTAALIAADSLNLSDLGKGTGGGGRGGNMGGQDPGNAAGETAAQNPADNDGGAVAQNPGENTGGAAPPAFESNSDDTTDQSLSNSTDQNLNNDSSKTARQKPGNDTGDTVRQNRTNADGKTTESNRPGQDRKGLEASETPAGSTDRPNDIIITGGLLAVLILAAVFIAHYKRKF